jgi:hypothetical protein
MKQWESKLLNVGQQTDIEAELNELGKSGWHFATALGTPFGVKFLLHRETDRQVSDSDELAKKFGI